jgi:hypothetical protein
MCSEREQLLPLPREFSATWSGTNVRLAGRARMRLSFSLLQNVPCASLSSAQKLTLHFIKQSA